MRAAKGGAELWKEGRAEPAMAPPLAQAPPSDLGAGGEAAWVEGVQRVPQRGHCTTEHLLLHKPGKVGPPSSDSRNHCIQLVKGSPELEALPRTERGWRE